jgi:3-oxoacyl-(acyl-carrier-protein) synthase
MRAFRAGMVLVSSTASRSGSAVGDSCAATVAKTVNAELLPPSAHLEEHRPPIPSDCIPLIAPPNAVVYSLSSSFGFDE